MDGIAALLIGIWAVALLVCAIACLSYSVAIAASVALIGAGWLWERGV